MVPTQVNRSGANKLWAAVMETVAEVIDQDPRELPPLYEVIDPEALESIFASLDSGPRRSEGKVEFPYAGCTVTVWADGSIEVEPHKDSPG